MNQFFIDTNIFLRALIKEDEVSNTESLEFLKKMRSGKYKAKTSSINIAELAWSLKSYYKLSKPKIITILRSIELLNGLKIIDNYDIKYAVELYETYNAKFTDCMIASIKDVRNKQLQLLSYDKDFDKMKIKRYEPKDL